MTFVLPIPINLIEDCLTAVIIAKRYTEQLDESQRSNEVSNPEYWENVENSLLNEIDKLPSPPENKLNKEN